MLGWGYLEGGDGILDGQVLEEYGVFQQDQPGPQPQAHHTHCRMNHYLQEWSPQCLAFPNVPSHYSIFSRDSSYPSGHHLILDLGWYPHQMPINKHYEYSP